MTSGTIRKNSIYSNVKDTTNYGKVHKVLDDSNLINYMQLVSNEEILFETNSEKIDKDLDKKAFYKFISSLFQSLTNTGYTTWEIVNFISNTVNNKNFASVKPEIINYLKRSIKIYHSNYQGKLSSKNYNVAKHFLFNHLKSDLGAYTSQAGAALLSKNKIYKRDLKVLTSFSNFNAANAALTDFGETTENAVKASFFNNFNSSPLNKSIKNPTKTKTSVSSILVTNPDMKVGTQNALELSAFFNSISTLELSKAYPYLDVTFVLPSLTDAGSSQDSHAKLRSSTINQFLFGTKKEKEVTKTYMSFEGDNLGKNRIRTNLSLFTTPQSLVNMDEKYGHAQNHKVSNRATTVNDPAKPFMTLKNFSINAAPTKGLMSYKTGKLSLVLHDRTRMNDIAPFVKPDLFGVFGAEIVIEYGWINGEHDSKMPKKNPLGYFIGNSRVVEKYMIVNSSMNIDNSGLVNIDLSIAMKGPYEFKAQQIKTSIKNRTNSQQLSNLFSVIRYNKEILIPGLTQEKINSIDSETAAIEKNFPDIFSKTERISEESISLIDTFVQKWKFIEDIADEFYINKEGSSDPTLIIERDNLQMNFLKSLLSVQITSRDESTIKLNKDYDVDQLNAAFLEIINAFKDIIALLENITSEDAEEEQKEKEVLQSVIGGLGLIDPFYPIELPQNVESEGDYVSLGTIINTIVQGYVANSGNFDEVQTIFYNTNETCGAMSCFNIATLLVSKFELKELLEGIFNKRTVITPESLISQIILRCVQHKDNPSYGLKDLYKERESVFDPVKPIDSDDSSKNFSLELSHRLHEIYYPGETFNKNNTLKFVIPQISMNFDCLTEKSVSNYERTILRISIYDRAETPFMSASNILEQIYSENLLKPVNMLSKLRKDLKSGKGTRENYIKQAEREIKRLLAKEILVKKGSKYYINHEKLSRNDERTSAFIGNTKDFYKQIYPSLTFGTQNTALLSANVSTINENKLQTIFLTRPDRNNQNEINSRVSADLPLRILPTQASVEIIGCPWVNFGQSLFLDFETGTTIDNKYVVTGITHNLSPGKFTTNLTLSYGDNYGQFESTSDLIDQLLKETGLDASEIEEIKLGEEPEESKEVDFEERVNALTVTNNWKSELSQFVNTGLLSNFGKSLTIEMFSSVPHQFVDLFPFLYYKSSFLESMINDSDALKEMLDGDFVEVMKFYLNSFVQKKLQVNIIEDQNQNNPYIQFNLINNASAEAGTSKIPFYSPKKLICKTNPKYAPAFIIDDTESTLSGFEFFIDISKKISDIKNYSKFEGIINDTIKDLLRTKSFMIAFQLELTESNSKGDATNIFNYPAFDGQKDCFKITYKTRNKFIIKGTKKIETKGHQIVIGTDIYSAKKFAGNPEAPVDFDYDESFLYASFVAVTVDNSKSLTTDVKELIEKQNIQILTKQPIIKFCTQFIRLPFDYDTETILSEKPVKLNDTKTIIKQEVQYNYKISLKSLQKEILDKFDNSSVFYELK